MRRITLIIFCLLSFFVAAAVTSDTTETTAGEKVQRRWFEPDFVPLQFAGNIGFLSTGLGFANRKDSYQFAFLYGYVPASISGIAVHSIAARNTFHLFQFPLRNDNSVLGFMNLTVNMELGGRSFFTLPDNMPSSYYDFPKSIHAIAGAGLKYRKYRSKHRRLSAIEFFAEASTYDALIWYKLRSKEITAADVFTLALGVNLFRR